MPKLLVIATGGTIDSAYPPEAATPDYVPTPETSAIPSALARLGLREGEDFEFVRQCHRDSKDMDAHQLHQIAECIRQHSECDRVLITHGTDTVPRNGRYLEEMLPYLGSPPTVLCTSMQPLRAQAASHDGTQADVFRAESQTDAWESLCTALKELEKPTRRVSFVAGNKVYDINEWDKHRVVQNGEVTEAQFVGRLAEKHPDRDHLRGW